MESTAEGGVSADWIAVNIGLIGHFTAEVEVHTRLEHVSSSSKIVWIKVLLIEFVREVFHTGN